VTRLLFIDQYGEIGGGQTVLISLLRATSGTYAVSVLAPGGGALEAAISKEFGDAITFIPCEEPRLTHGRKSLSDILLLLAYGIRFRKHLPLLRAQDVIWVNGLRHLPHMLRLSRKIPARIIYHVHLAHSRLERALLRHAARARQTFRLVVNSRFVAHGLDIPEDRLFLIENALNPAFAGRAFVDRFRQAGPWKGAVFGTLRPEKGQDIAVRAAAGQLRLHIVGRDGDGAADWIAGLRREAGPSVRFDGPATDIPSCIDAMNPQFSLVPSRVLESFGLVAIESMACSCFTIVSGRGGLAEIAERTGALVACDGADLTRVLATLCETPAATLSAMAQRQFEATQHYYAPARFEAQVQALLTAAFAGRSPSL
jgi:glycosyltransferase involved in cell wall biosynthesis